MSNDLINCLLVLLIFRGIISECKPLLNKTLITNQTTESSSIEADLLIKINSSNKLNSRKKNIFNNTNRIIESKQINLFDYNIMEYIDLKSKTIISTLNNYFIESNELTTTTTATTTTKQMTSALNTTTLSIPFIQDNPQFMQCVNTCGSDHECIRQRCLLDSTYFG